jgi:hypothetical protein
VDEALSYQLEEAFQTIKPWKESYQDEILAAMHVGAAAYEKLKLPLADTEGSVFFDDASSARLIYNSFTNRVSSALFSTLRTNRTNSLYPTAPLVYRGYDEAVQRSSAPSRPTSTSPPRPATAVSGSSAEDRLSRRKSMDAKLAQKVAERTLQESQSSSTEPNTTAADAKVGEGRSQDVTDLILVVHGIGQGVRYSILYDALLICLSAFSTI